MRPFEKKNKKNHLSYIEKIRKSLLRGKLLYEIENIDTENNTIKKIVAVNSCFAFSFVFQSFTWPTCTVNLLTSNQIDSSYNRI